VAKHYLSNITQGGGRWNAGTISPRVEKRNEEEKGTERRERIRVTRGEIPEKGENKDFGACRRQDIRESVPVKRKK